MSAAGASRRLSATDRVAVLISDLLAPPVSVFLICLVAGVAGRPHAWSGLVWGLVLAILCAAVPMSAVKLAKRRGTITTQESGWKRKRWLAFAVSAASIVCCVVLAVVFHAPPLALWALATMLVGLVATSAITAAGLKVSMHAFCLISLLMMLCVLFSTWWLVAVVLMVPLMLFARVHLGEHTAREVVVGSICAVLLVLLAAIVAPAAG
ncbi:hypothetical protein [Brachybacterium kimchii]|uniref:Uncharacterized protein n=2 Tax=Brachybacterium TaxID=43668 RepID=A0ABY4NBB3_9MICO|nr:hypothetical protein [Brachybacterium kimchii]UQN30595.1 hypothetical protein M4486_04585 [Brachybacterium kimchii]